MEENHIEFDTDEQSLPAAHFTSQGSAFSPSQPTGMVGWLIRKGIIQTEAQAGGILVAVTIINFLIAILVIYFFVVK